MREHGRTILIHLARRSMLEATAACFSEERYRSAPESVREEAVGRNCWEVHHLTKVFLEHGWRCYWVAFDEIDVERLHHPGVYEVATGRRLDLSAAELGEQVDVVLARVIGSVERGIHRIRPYFEGLQAAFPGLVVNDPASVVYGLRKDYLFEYAKAGFGSIPTEYFERTVTFAELEREYRGHLDEHIIKPVTGELGNSFALLSDLDEATLRSKETLVGGWLVQPFMPTVWDGEYQLFFIGDTLVQGMRKTHHQAAGVRVPQRTSRAVEVHSPSQAEEAFARDAKAFWTQGLGLPTELCRVDFIKDTAGAPLLLEFEAVNPGFYLGAMATPQARQVAGLFERHIAMRISRG